nr:unnamed protein product [Digitaria exilis]
MVGTEARMRVSSVIFCPSSSGTLRSARTNTFFPFRSASPRVPTLLLVAITPCKAAARIRPEPGEPDGDGSGGRRTPFPPSLASKRRLTADRREPDRIGGEHEDEDDEIDRREADGTEYSGAVVPLTCGVGIGGSGVAAGEHGGLERG